MPRADKHHSAAATVTGVVLAGGLARRMGGQDKGLITLLGRPMIAYVLDALQPQVDALLVNANRNLEAYAALGHPVVADRDGEFSGPLAGMAAAMARAHTDCILTVPCDGPWLPPDLAARLRQAMQREDAEICAVHSGERLEPVFALLRCSLLPSLEHYLAAGGRKIDRWYAEHRLRTVDFSDRPEAFLNVNTPADRDAVEQRLAEQRPAGAPDRRASGGR